MLKRLLLIVMAAFFWIAGSSSYGLAEEKVKQTREPLWSLGAGVGFGYSYPVFFGSSLANLANLYGGDSLSGAGAIAFLAFT
ncbi:MAG TPA: hypothetical protein VM425_20065 [Myxococcota bacterium]|nr:hypothetical protein [Myxococcota bacterium]